MKRSIGNKLMTSVAIVLAIILLMVAANRVVVRLFKNTSTHLVVEYNELDAIQEFKLTLGKLLMFVNHYAVHEEEHDESQFKTMVNQAHDNLGVCREVVTSRHERLLFDELETTINRVDSLAHEMFQLQIAVDRVKVALILDQISSEVDEGIADIDILLNETKLEIDEYVGINNTVIRHSTITIFTLGLTVILIIVVGGLLFIRNITKPIKDLVNTTNRISRGDRSAKVVINTNDELHTLADSFNQMVETLEQTTVSKDYLDNILKNMFDALIVTDDKLKIRSANKAASDLLGYDKKDLIGQDIRILFHNSIPETASDNYGDEDMKRIISLINKENWLRSNSGAKIPALISCAIMKNQNNETDGLILVGHDLTDKKVIEQKLEKVRKERLIAINEAQDEERIRIATDLHDGLGQMLTAISYSVQDLFTEEAKENTIGQASIIKIQEQIDATIREAKNLAHNLIPVVLKDFGLIVAINHLINRANDLYDTKFRFNAFDFNDRIDPKREKVFYRICQETLNNIVKHAKAENATYQIFWQDCSVVLVIEDDGIGFDVTAQDKKSKNSGIGLISMRERVLSFDGGFTINSEPGQGTEIIVEIPCPKL